jgi:Uncharacterized protein conserved in bacteria
MTDPGADPQQRLARIELDPQSLAAAAPEAEHDRDVAIFDLLERNFFALADAPGPYKLFLSVVEQRLVFDVRTLEEAPLRTFVLSLTPLRRVIKDYFMICDSYYAAIRQSTPSQIETLDMARRGVHNDASDILMARLEGKVRVDFDTARRLFTLICALHGRL